MSQLKYLKASSRTVSCIMRFSPAHNEAFASLSGDRNPIHFDLRCARINQLEKPVVYGVVSVFCALGKWAQSRKFCLGRIQADFFHPIFPGENYELEILEKGQTGCLRVFSGQTCVVEINFDWQPPSAELAWPNTSYTAAENRYLPNGSALDAVLELCALSRGQLPWHQFSALLWSTHFVSTKFQPSTVVYTSFEFSFFPFAGGAETLVNNLSVRSDDRFRLKFIEGSGDGIKSFCLQARICPQPVRYTLEEFSPNFPKRDLTANSVFISGASRGFGSVLALAFGLCGAQVFVNYHTCQEEAENVVQQLARIGTKAWAIRGDVASEQDCLRMREFVRKSAGSIDFLLNNASTKAKDYPGKAQNEAEISLKMTTLPTEIFAPLLNPGGKIIFISSKFVELEPRGFEKYVHSKIAIENWAKSYSKINPEKKILVIRPPRMLTDQTVSSPTAAASAIQVAEDLFDSFF
ncbi:MAG: SDR family NAD(P)-dependent oxidoreductase [Bdellovibrionota bacterium]